VADLSHVWVVAQVFEDRFAAVKVGQPVEATVGAYPGEVFEGRVAFIDPSLNPATRTVNVRYDLENADHRLRPGMFATVTLKTSLADSPTFRGGTAATGSSPDRQKVCPVTTLKLGAMGAPVAVEVAGRKVWACCAACAPKLKASPAKYLARLDPPLPGGVLSVPESAVIDSGTRKVVYVEVEPGVFEGRAVVLGPRSGDRYPVHSGLAPGEKVAAAGAFLIDAETRLNPAAGGSSPGAPAAPATDGKTKPTETPPPVGAGSGLPRTAAAPVKGVHRH
jgi:Cu(I)/Ag(I) efflux system membrane fusion protein